MTPCVGGGRWIAAPLAGHKAILTMTLLCIRGAQLESSLVIINSHQAIRVIIALENIVLNQVCTLNHSLMGQL
jgi:hypothetical protein